MKTLLIVASRGRNPEYVLFTLYELDLADMVTLIDWGNENPQKVQEKIVYTKSKPVLDESDLLASIKLDDFSNQKAEDEFIETYASELAKANAQGSAYFTNLYNWNQRPPRKPRASGEIKELIVPRILMDRSFILEEGLYVLVKDKEERNLNNVLRDSGLSYSSIRFSSKVDYDKDEMAFKEIIDAHLNNERSHIAFSPKEIATFQWLLVNTPMYKKLF